MPVEFNYRPELSDNHRMTDVYTKAKRSEIMARIKGSKTSPEKIVASMLRKLKVKYRSNVKSLPGQPDFVISSIKTVIFVNGCFWHRHNCKKGRSMPSTRKKFWNSKFKRTIERDKNNHKKLKKLGWRVLVIWECKTKTIEKLSRRLRVFLNKTSQRRSRS